MKLKELLEGIGQRKLYHFTDYISLKKILESKMLKAYTYPGTPDGTKQISTLRKSMANPKNVDVIGTGTNGGVKIIIDAEKASDNARGMKVKTIAEFPLYYKKAMKNVNQKDYNQGNKKPLSDKFIKQIMKDIEKIKSKDVREISVILNNKYPKKLYDNDRVNRQAFSELVDHYFGYKQSTTTREGEERITFKKGNGLPINNKYIKIELTKPMRYIPNESKKKIIDEIKKNKDLFVKNDIYKEVVGEK